MPTYVYECTACARRWEKFQSIRDPAVTDCECGSTGSVRKIMQPVGIAFKGSGFYVNDMGANASAKETPKVETTETKTAEATPAPAAPAASPTPAATTGSAASSEP